MGIEQMLQVTQLWKRSTIYWGHAARCLSLFCDTDMFRLLLARHGCRTMLRDEVRERYLFFRERFIEGHRFHCFPFYRTDKE